MHYPRSKSARQLLIVLFCLALSLPAISQNSILEEKGFIKFNDLEQWITIKGDRSKPVVLFLHGGPGSPLSLYADALFRGWEKDFILVQWDQRGAGKTYGHNAPEELTPAYLSANRLTVDQMTKDGIEVAEYLIAHLGKQKIILFGTSWGSVLGVQMAQKRPDLFYAYVGHSQVVPGSDNLKLAYPKVYGLAQKANDQPSIKTLQAIGKPPYDTARHAGQLFRIIKKYEHLRAKSEPEAWLKITADYDNEKDNQHRADGDDYSFVSYVGDRRLGVPPMAIPVGDPVFKIPVYLIQGAEDILTPKEVSRSYFEKIKAPHKEYILLPGAAHGFNSAVVATLFKLCHKIGR